VLKLHGRCLLEYGGQVPGEQSVKRWSEPFKVTESALLKRNLSRPSVDTATPLLFVKLLSAAPGISISHVGRECQILLTTYIKALAYEKLDSESIATK
jgi:hypothetical protein